MTPEQQAAAHDANFVGFFQAAARVLDAGTQATYGSVPLVTTGVPVPFFNGGWVTGPAGASDIGAALEHLRGSGMPFVLHVRSDLPDAEGLASPFGLSSDGLLPCFAIEPMPIPPPPAELVMRRAGPAEWEDLLATTAVAFGLPRPMVDALYAPELLEQPGVRAYVGYAGGHPVTVSISYRSGSTIGIYSVGTVPDARGHGYGSEATWHLMRDAEPGWEVAVLQASDMGRPIYERMGFRLVREFIEYVHRPG
jgi:hypothetical protein